MHPHIIIKLLKRKEKEKQPENNGHTTYKRTTLEVTADYSGGTRVWEEV